MTTTQRAALITGGSKGIGRGIAETLAASGFNVLITARNAEEVRRTAEQLDGAYEGRVLGVACDVRDAAQQRDAVARAVEAFGGLDLLVANAGVGRFSSIETMQDQDWHDVIDTNVTGVYLSVKAALEALIERQGMIITIGSLAGTNFFAGGSAYNARKFALAGFSQAIMLDLRDRGVRVSTIMPGSVTSHFNDHEPSDADAWKIQPEDIGAMVLHLVNLPARTLPSKIEVRPSRPPSSR